MDAGCPRRLRVHRPPAPAVLPALLSSPLLDHILSPPPPVQTKSVSITPQPPPRLPAASIGGAPPRPRPSPASLGTSPSRTPAAGGTVSVRFAAGFHLACEIVSRRRPTWLEPRSIDPLDHQFQFTPNKSTHPNREERSRLGFRRRWFEMMPPVVQSAAVPSGAVLDHGRPSRFPIWTGDKRRRTAGGPSPRPLGLSSSSGDTTDAMLMDHDSDTRSQVQDEQGWQQRKEFVFSAEDHIDEEEFSRCCKELLSRERPIYAGIAPRLKGKDKLEVYNRLCGLRFREYKILEKGSLDDTLAAVPVSEYPDEVFEWDSPFVPGSSMFGWSYDFDYFDIAELDDYQRIVLTINDLREYLNWEKYRLAFSSYEADEDYVNYWDELLKKMKWVEDVVLDYEQFFLMYGSRVERQALKIAQGFCRLPLSLAILGYDEYVKALVYDLDRRKGYDQLYFEVWKRVSKQEMTFKEAFKDILSAGMKLPSTCLHRVRVQGFGVMQKNYDKCMGYIRELVGDGGEGAILKKHFTDAVYSKIQTPKMYVDYAKKKLEVARRIHLIPGMNRPQRIENCQSVSGNSTVR